MSISDEKKNCWDFNIFYMSILKMKKQANSEPINFKRLPNPVSFQGTIHNDRHIFKPKNTVNK